MTLTEGENPRIGDFWGLSLYLTMKYPNFVKCAHNSIFSTDSDSSRHALFESVVKNEGVAFVDMVGLVIVTPIS